MPGMTAQGQYEQEVGAIRFARLTSTLKDSEQDADREELAKVFDPRRTDRDDTKADRELSEESVRAGVGETAELTREEYARQPATTNQPS